MRLADCVRDTDSCMIHSSTRTDASCLSLAWVCPRFLRISRQPQPKGLTHRLRDSEDASETHSERAQGGVLLCGPGFGLLCC